MYKSLQAGRGIAAILVVLFHLGQTIAAEKYFNMPAFAVPFAFGNSGVEFFFVLSGFIILTAHRQDMSNPGRLRSYLEKRLSRIFPTYWLIYLGVYTVAWSVGPAHAVVSLDPMGVIKEMLLWPPSKQQTGGISVPVLIVAWSLQFELLFYAIFAILILNRALGSCLLTVWMGYYVWSHVAAAHASLILPFLTQDYVALFWLGMGASALCHRLKLARRPAWAFLLTGAALFVLTAIEKIASLAWSGPAEILLDGVASALLIVGLVQLEASGRAMGAQPWLQLLGDSSYALYLIHFPLISILCKLSMAIHIDILGVGGAMLTYGAAFSACVLSAVCFHLWVEKPLAHQIRLWLAARHPSMPDAATTGACSAAR
jgi:exopolysaccharide production protein ExoZ